MKNAILLFLCCLPAFADSVTSTQLLGTYSPNGTTPTTLACVGDANCQATIGAQIGDTNYQYATIDSSASFVGSHNGAYVLNADLHTFDQSKPGIGAGAATYSNAKIALIATYNVPVDAGNIYVTADMQRFSSLLEFGDARLINYDPLLITTSQGTYSLQTDCSPSYCYPAPELSFTLLHTPGAPDSVTISAAAESFWDSEENVSISVSLSNTPEPGTFGMLFGSLVLGGLVVGWRKRIVEPVIQLEVSRGGGDATAIFAPLRRRNIRKSGPNSLSLSSCSWLLRHVRA